MPMNKIKHASLDNVEVIFRSSRDQRGLLTFAEGMKDFPFHLKRIFWITDVSREHKRGGHAHRKCKQMICCVKGSFRLIIHNGIESREFLLDNPNRAIVIQEGVWCSLEDFAEGTVVLVGASEYYNMEGYIRDYDEFMSIYGKKDDVE